MEFGGTILRVEFHIYNTIVPHIGTTEINNLKILPIRKFIKSSLNNGKNIINKNN